MLGERLYHADDHAVGQVYYALHSQQSVPHATAMSPTQTSFDAILAAPASDVSLDFSIAGGSPSFLLQFSCAADSPSPWLYCQDVLGRGNCSTSGYFTSN